MSQARLITVTTVLATGIAGLSCQGGELGGAPTFDLSAANSVSTPAFVVPFGTATMDGILGDEWVGALTFPMYDDVGQVIDGARILVMNDATHLYVGLFVPDAPGADWFDVRFDNDGDGVLDGGEDEVIVLGPGIETDPRLVDSHSELGDFCCWGFEDGHRDGAAVVSVSGNGVTYEVSHPLNSGDADDLSVSPGSELGMCALYYDAPTFELRHSPLRCGYLGLDLSEYTRLILSGPPRLDVAIDIKPGGVPNPVNLKSKGVIPVAILSDGTFDAGSVDAATVRFGPSGVSSVGAGSLLDVNEDGLPDLVLQFRTQEAGFTAGDSEGCLSGMTVGGAAFAGCDAVVVRGTAVAAVIIDFETYPDGSPTCADCPLTDQYASLGVTFSFESPFTDQTHASLTQTTNNPEGVPNHDATNQQVPTGGSFVGTIVMTFTGSPIEVRFEARVNNIIPQTPVAAYDPNGVAISASQIERSDAVVYSVGTVAFRQEVITITNTSGIARVEIDTQGGSGVPGFLVLIDEVRITR